MNNSIGKNSNSNNNNNENNQFLPPPPPPPGPPPSKNKTKNTNNNNDNNNNNLKEAPKRLSTFNEDSSKKYKDGLASQSSAIDEDLAALSFGMYSFTILN